MRIDPVAKRIVAIYLNMFLWQRSPAVRDRQVAEINEAKLLAWSHEEIKRTAELSDLYRDSAPIAASKAASDLNGLMAGHWESSTFQRWLFYSMSWAVLRCTKPIVTIPDQGLVRPSNSGILNDGRGLLDPQAEFYLPLSSTRILVVSWRGGPPDKIQLVTASPAHIRRISKFGFGQASRFVYATGESEKLAVAVQQSPRHIPTLKPLRMTGGPNPKADELGKLKAWFEKLGTDDPARHWCMAPGAGEHCRHNWRRLPNELPVVSDKPEFTTPVYVCEWCFAFEWRYRNGHVKFDDMELRRLLKQPPMKNWWELFDVTHAGNCIEACGTIPLYRVAE